MTGKQASGALASARCRRWSGSPIVPEVYAALTGLGSMEDDLARLEPESAWFCQIGGRVPRRGHHPPHRGRRQAPASRPGPGVCHRWSARRQRRRPAGCRGGRARASRVPLPRRRHGRGDHAAQRQSVNARWGNLVAIVAGDFLLARSAAIAASLGTEIAQLLANTLGRLCEGQVAEVRTAFSTQRTEEDYYNAIAGKTAALMATSCRIGALTGGRGAMRSTR